MEKDRLHHQLRQFIQNHRKTPNLLTVFTIQTFISGSFVFSSSRNAHKSSKLYTCMQVSILNLGAIVIVSTFVLIHFGILLGKLLLRHRDAIQYLMSIVGNESNIIPLAAISIAIARTNTPESVVFSCFLHSRIQNFHD